MVKRVWKPIKDLGHLGPMALATTFLPILGSLLLITFLEPIGQWLRENWASGAILYLCGTLLLCGLALLPTNVIGVLGGWAFSFELGLLILMLTVVGSSLISFKINSHISGDRLPDVAGKHPRAEAIYRSLLGESFWKTTLIIFLIRLSVVMPFAFTNFLMASARVPLRSFLLGTAAGMLPRSTAMVLVGDGLSELTLENSGDTYVLIMGIAATICSAIIIAAISRRALARLTVSSFADPMN